MPADVTADKVWDASLNGDNSVIAYYTVNSDTSLYNVVIGRYGKVQFPTNSLYLFRNYTKLKTISFGDYIDTTKVTNMHSMFSNCSNLENFDINRFDTHEVTSMSYLFYKCVGLTNLDLGNFDTSKVIDMKYMFFSCSGLANLDVSNFDTANVTVMESMFYNCSGLTSLDLSNFDTSNVMNMKYMFSGCSNLVTLNLSSFTNQISVDHGIITQTTSMIYGCSKLEELHLEKWNFAGDGDTTIDMAGIPKTENVYISKEQVNNFNAFSGYECNIIGV